MQSCLELFSVVDWDDVAIWCTMQLKGKSLQTRLCKLSLGAVVYYIWIQRNNLIHGNVVCSEEGLIARIKWEIRSRLMGKGQYRRSMVNIRLLQNWNLHNLLMD